MKTEKNFFNVTYEAKNYLAVVWVIFVIAAIMCIGLLINGLWLVDGVNAYIAAIKLTDGLMRMTAAATLMTVIIDLYARR